MLLSQLTGMAQHNSDLDKNNPQPGMPEWTFEEQFKISSQKQKSQKILIVSDKLFSIYSLYLYTRLTKLLTEDNF